MATKAGPQVSAVVDEEANTVTVGVVHNGQFLPVASKDLGYASAVGLDAKGEPTENDSTKDEG